MIQVIPISEAKIPDPTPFIIKNLNGWKLYMDKGIAPQDESLSLDLSGWGSFERLTAIVSSGGSSNTCEC